MRRKEENVTWIGQSSVVSTHAAAAVHMPMPASGQRLPAGQRVQNLHNWLFGQQQIPPISPSLCRIALTLRKRRPRPCFLVLLSREFIPLRLSSPSQRYFTPDFSRWLDMYGRGGHQENQSDIYQRSENESKTCCNFTSSTRTNAAELDFHLF